MDIPIPEDENSTVSERWTRITQRCGATFQKTGALKRMYKLEGCKALDIFSYSSRIIQ
jgi:hypothetical protein